MKLKSTFTVELNDVDGKSKITFRKPPTNEQLKKEVTGDAQKDGMSFMKDVFESIVLANGFFAEDGHELTLDEIKESKDEVLQSTILWMWIEGRNGILSKDAITKKISAIS